MFIHSNIIESYDHYRVIGEENIIAVSPMLYTTALLYGCDRTGCRGRYYFARQADALAAFHSAVALDELHPPLCLRWNKHKGISGDYVVTDLVHAYETGDGDETCKRALAQYPLLRTTIGLRLQRDRGEFKSIIGETDEI
jgi:hypothetical protein